MREQRDDNARRSAEIPWDGPRYAVRVVVEGGIVGWWWILLALSAKKMFARFDDLELFFFLGVFYFMFWVISG